MAKKCKESDLQNLPVCAADFIKLVIKKMHYRKKVRAEVMAELTAHFEDELRGCATDEEKERRARQLIEDFGDAKLLGTLLRRAKKRCRPLWRTIVARTFQTVGILILCFISYCVYISLGRPTISVNYVEEATRLARPVADESLNAAPLYQKAFDAYKEPPLVEDETGTEIRLDAIKKDWPTELTGEELPLMKQWLSDNTDAIEFFKQASEKPYCWWKRKARDNLVMVVLMPELTSMKNFVRVMVWQAKMKAYDGHIEEAFDDLLACYRAERHFRGQRSLIEQLVGMGIQAVSTKNILVILDNQQADSQSLKNLQTQLEELMEEDVYTINYEVERFFALDFIQRCYTNNGRGSGHMIPGQIKILDSDFIDIGIGRVGYQDSAFNKYSKYLAMALFSASRREMNREFEKFYKTIEKVPAKTPWQLRKECFDFEMGLDNWSTLKQARYWPVPLLVPTIKTVSEVAYRVKMQTEVVITTLAVIRFKQITGNYPDNLEGLVAAGYLKKIPLDPFSDKPLVYKKTADNFTLYSVGFNFKDDGGQTYRNEKGKPKLWHDELGDAVFWPVQK
ncbi:MAG: hypothetical protein WC476_05565 [Phycisphaerae bacterium]|jgi:hypothetical protein